MSDCRITYLEGRMIGTSPTERYSLRKSIEEQRTDPSWGHYTKGYSQTFGFTRDELELAALKVNVPQLIRSQPHFQQGIQSKNTIDT